MKCSLTFLGFVCMISSAANAQGGDRSTSVRLTVTTPLEYVNTPLDPTIDFGEYVAQSRSPGVFDPNSIVVQDVTTGERVPHALSEDFAYADRGRVELVIVDPTHVTYDIRFSTIPVRKLIEPQAEFPAIGVGDLLRYNAGVPRPITTFYSMCLHDLNGDGIADLTGTWNYAYRPGSPWDGVIVYPGVDPDRECEFGELVRLRHDADGPQFFSHIYMSSAFADFNGDERLDLVVTRRGTGQAELFLNTGRADHSGMPLFRSGGSVPVAGWQACRAVDLDQDGAIDLVVEGEYVRNTNRNGWPFEPAASVQLDAGRLPCFLDVDADELLDAVGLEGGQTVQPDFHHVAWRKNLGDTPPRFGEPQLINEIDVPLCTAVSAYHEGGKSGLMVQHNAYQEISLFQLRAGDDSPQFERRGRAESRAAVMSLSDQAWPCLCDWDEDGDLDMLVGGGYGWPRIVINEGTRSRPEYSKPQLILADGQPIRLLRDEILGDPPSSHNMGYPYPEFVDWNADGLKDLILPNETNRIFWYPNIGSRGEPRFGQRQQIVVADAPDSDALRAQSATRAADPQSNNGVYPLEPEQPFFWRTGVAIADFDGNELPDLITHHGHKRIATLFTQAREEDGSLVLHKAGPLSLDDGTPINDAIVNRTAHWTESFRAIDWDRDGLMDLIYSIAGAHNGSLDGGSIYLLRNTGDSTSPRFASPQTMTCFGEPIRITNHGPHPRPCDYDGDGQPDLITCVEWSVYPYYAHAALMMAERPTYSLELLSTATHEPRRGR
ncbi:MAG: VCBS repeat-containing protein [Planctomycetaceae bacterium]|nr:VCBS repeat-containing protein [Planctomycetaceae bacterium]